MQVLKPRVFKPMIQQCTVVRSINKRQPKLQPMNGATKFTNIFNIATVNPLNSAFENTISESEVVADIKLQQSTYAMKEMYNEILNTYNSCSEDEGEEQVNLVQKLKYNSRVTQKYIFKCHQLSEVMKGQTINILEMKQQMEKTLQMQHTSALNNKAIQKMK